MKRPLRHLIRQPILGILLSTLALLVLIGAWMRIPLDLLSINGVRIELVALFLVIALIVTSLSPIHIRYHTKVSITSVPLYIMAVLLPLPIAALSAGLGILIEQLLTRSKRGSLPSDIATAVSRLILVVCLGAWVAHLPAPNSVMQAVALFSTAVIMFLSDIVTCAFEITAMSAESPSRIIVVSMREGGTVEAIQYLLGILGVLAAFQQIWALGLLIFPIGFVYLAFKSAKEMHDSTHQLLESMADAVDLRDPYTGGHSRRVAEYCAGILREWPMYGVEADLIITAARVHDIGKIGIPDGVLNKPDLLTPEERAIMESHAGHGADFLARYPDFARGVTIVRHHHERWDGKGYPDGLKEFDIPFGARVIAVADSFDAMTSDRPYRRGRSFSEAAQIVRNDGGQQWEPAVAYAFLRSIADRLEQPEEIWRPSIPCSSTELKQSEITTQSL
jgi:HD-GYP domain-containing protein (c-di-GMP phosphodiesterase class II)